MIHPPSDDLTGPAHEPAPEQCLSPAPPPHSVEHSANTAITTRLAGQLIATVFVLGALGGGLAAVMNAYSDSSPAASQASTVTDGEAASTNHASNRVSSAPTPVSRPSVSSDLSEEVRLIAQAQKALITRDTRRAHRLLEAHVRDFADGLLAEDRDATRVLLLCQQRKPQEARTAAAHFGSLYPHSPHATRVRRCARKIAASK